MSSCPIGQVRITTRILEMWIPSKSTVYMDRIIIAADTKFVISDTWGGTDVGASCQIVLPDNIWGVIDTRDILSHSKEL